MPAQGINIIDKKNFWRQATNVRAQKWRSVQYGTKAFSNVRIRMDWTRRAIWVAISREARSIIRNAIKYSSRRRYREIVCTRKSQELANTTLLTPWKIRSPRFEISTGIYTAIVPCSMVSICAQKQDSFQEMDAFLNSFKERIAKLIHLHNAETIMASSAWRQMFHEREKEILQIPFKILRMRMRTHIRTIWIIINIGIISKCRDKFNNLI